MCDPTAVIGSLFSGGGGASPLPWQMGPFQPPSIGQRAGSFLDGVGGTLAKSAFEAFGAGQAGAAQQEAIGKRQAQIAFGAKLDLEAQKLVADRRLGGQRGRIAKAGLKVKGTTRQILEEQIKQDELALLKIGINRDIALGEEDKASSQSSLATTKRIAQAITPVATDIFGFGK